MSATGKRIPIRPILCVLLVWVSFGLTSARGGQTHACEFLRLANEPVGRSMAGAHVATVAGVASLAWNPAGLGCEEPGEVVLSHASWMAESSWEWGAIAFPIRRGRGAIGVCGGVLRAGELQGYDTKGVPQGDFTPQQLFGSIGYGVAFSRAVSAGFMIEAAREDDGFSAARSLWAGGAGVQFRYARLAFGVAALHLGPPLETDSGRFPLPAMIRGGASVYGTQRMAFHAAVEWLADGPARFMAGWQWEPVNGVSALVGARHDPDEDGSPIRPAYGLALESGAVGFAYGYLPAAWLDASHQLSIRLRFARAR